MKHVDVIRAWKDPEYRLSLSEAERVLLPAHPAGLMELTDAQLDAVGGGGLWDFLFSVAAGVVGNYLYAHGEAIITASTELNANNVAGKPKPTPYGL